MIKARLPFIVGAVLVLTFACAKERVYDLTEQAKTYNRSLRWGSIPAAGTLVAEDVRRGVIHRLSKDLDNVKIVDFSIVDLGLDEKKKKGSVIVNFSYYKIDQEVLKNRQEIQYWEYSTVHNKWMLHDYKAISAGR